MSKLRSVSTGFWSDPFVEELSPNDKLLFLYLITNDKTNMLGIYESSVRKISFETGLSQEDIKNGLKGFERVHKVRYVNNYIILINYMKHQNFNPNMKKSAIDIYNSLPNSLKDSKLIVDKSKPLEGFESLLNHFGMVRKVEVEYEVEVKTELESKDKPIVFSKAVHDCYYNCIQYFPKELIPSDDKTQNSWMDSIDKLNRLDHHEFTTIEHVVKLAREDDFWVDTFMSLPKLRKKNKDGIQFMVFFIQKFKNKNNGQITNIIEQITEQYPDL